MALPVTGHQDRARRDRLPGWEPKMREPHTRYKPRAGPRRKPDSGQSLALDCQSPLPSHQRCRFALPAHQVDPPRYYRAPQYHRGSSPTAHRGQQNPELLLPGTESRAGLQSYQAAQMRSDRGHKLEDRQ